MAEYTPVLFPEESILDKLERVSPGARTDIIALTHALEAARQEEDSSLTRKFMRLCRKGFRDMATANILSAGPYGMGAVNPYAIDIYHQARAQNETEDYREDMETSADICRFAILQYMRNHCLHGSMLDLTPKETSSLAMALPGNYRRLSALHP